MLCQCEKRDKCRKKVATRLEQLVTPNKNGETMNFMYKKCRCGNNLSIYIPRSEFSQRLRRGFVFWFMREKPGSDNL